MTALEGVANAVMALSIWLAARNSIHTWSTGIVACLLFGILFYGNQLYADATLQVFFIITSIVGWWHWRHFESSNQIVELPTTRTTAAALGGWVLGGVLFTVGYGWRLHRFTDAYLPYIDAAVMALSVIAQLLLMQRKIETWRFWLAVNSISVCLFASRGLFLTSALYGAFWINAWYEWGRWRGQVSVMPTVAG